MGEADLLSPLQTTSTKKLFTILNEKFKLNLENYGTSVSLKNAMLLIKTKFKNLKDTEKDSFIQDIKNVINEWIKSNEFTDSFQYINSKDEKKKIEAFASESDATIGILFDKRTTDDMADKIFNRKIFSFLNQQFSAGYSQINGKYFPDPTLQVEQYVNNSVELIQPRVDVKNTILIRTEALNKYQKDLKISIEKKISIENKLKKNIDIQKIYNTSSADIQKYSKSKIQSFCKKINFEIIKSQLNKNNGLSITDVDLKLFNIEDIDSLINCAYEFPETRIGKAVRILMDVQDIKLDIANLIKFLQSKNLKNCGTYVANKYIEHLEMLNPKFSRVNRKYDNIMSINSLNGINYDSITSEEREMIRKVVDYNKMLKYGTKFSTIEDLTTELKNAGYKGGFKIGGLTIGHGSLESFKTVEDIAKYAILNPKTETANAFKRIMNEKYARMKEIVTNFYSDENGVSNLKTALRNEGGYRGGVTGTGGTLNTLTSTDDILSHALHNRSSQTAKAFEKLIDINISKLAALKIHANNQDELLIQTNDIEGLLKKKEFIDYIRNMDLRKEHYHPGLTGGSLDELLNEKDPSTAIESHITKNHDSATEKYLRKVIPYYIGSLSQ